MSVEVRYEVWFIRCDPRLGRCWHHDATWASLRAAKRHVSRDIDKGETTRIDRVTREVVHQRRPTWPGGGIK